MIHFTRLKKAFSEVGNLGIVLFIMTLGFSLIDTIWALYLYHFLQSTVLVGLLSSFFTFVSLLGFIFLIPFIEKHDKAQLHKWSILLSGVCYVGFALTNSIFFVILLAVLLALVSVVRIDSFGILVRDSASRSNLAKDEAVIYSLFNLAWVIGPLLAGFLAQRYDMSLLFLLAAFFIFLSLLSFKLSHIHYKRRISKIVSGNVFHNIKDFIKNKDLVKSYLIGGTSTVWWSFLFVYIPVHMVQEGLGVETVAYFIFAITVPVLGLEYIFAKYADKYGYIPLFLLGNLFLATILIISFFIQNIYGILLLLIIGSVGVSRVEASSEAYFFMVAPKKRIEKYYSIFNTTIDVSSIVPKIVIAGVLLMLPFQYSFLVMALFFLGLAYVSLRMKEVVPHGH